MIKYTILLYLMILPTISIALPSDIRAGEHDTFSRLVIDIDVGAIWKIGRISDGYAVEIEGASTYNFDEVFNRIPPKRIQSIREASLETRFELLTKCECHISAFLWRPDKLVIDVNDGLPNSDSLYESAIDTPSIQTLSKSITLPIVTSREAVKRIRKNEDITTSNFADIANEHAHLDALEEIVVRSLARGATQGLLTPAEPLETNKNPRPITSKQQIDAHFDNNHQLGLLAHTSIDLGSGNASEVDVKLDEDCISDGYFDIVSWASGKGFAEDVSPIRVALAKELDVVDFDEVTRLAKALIYYGFGREAIAALQLDQEMSQERMILAKIGAIIDGDPVDPNFFLDQIGCENSSALWAFLANLDNPKKPNNLNSILRSFRALPINLQKHLGPRLGDMFTQLGDFDSAIMILSADSDTVPDNTEKKLAEADLLIGLGSISEATATLADFVATDSRTTPEALSKFMNLALNSGEIVSESDLALADILRFEFRGQSSIEELVKVQARVLTEIGEIDRALNLLTEEGDTVGEDYAAQLISDVFLKAVDVLPEKEFLELAFSKTTDDAQPAAQNAVAKKLLKFGLAERASLLVKGPANGAEMSERRYLRAEAALELNLAPLALTSLEGLRTPRANALRERAMFQSENIVGNGEILVGNDWRQGNWTSLNLGSDALLKSVSQSMLNEPVSVIESGQTLASSQSMIEKSEQSRALIDSLFSRFAPIEN